MVPRNLSSLYVGRLGVKNPVLQGRNRVHGDDKVAYCTDQPDRQTRPRTLQHFGF